MVIKDTQFVMKNHKATQPEIATDGLQLYYDTKGKKDTDAYNDKLLDMGGNNKHATLSNFAFSKGSGYSEGLVFDGVDDRLVRPALPAFEMVSAGVNTDLMIPKMTYQLNSNILSYDEGGVVKRVHNGNVVERRGVNLVRNGNFFNGTTGWASSTSKKEAIGGALKITPNGGLYIEPVVLSELKAVNGHKIYVCTLTKLGKNSISTAIMLNAGVTQRVEGLNRSQMVEGYNKIEGIISLENQTADSFIRAYCGHYYKNEGDSMGDVLYIKNYQIVDLTATYGAGNEPTLEQIQANPDAWAWTPNPMDLIEATELKGNILGDVEGIIDDLNKDVVAGKGVYTAKADDSVVRVEVDGLSEQNAGSGKNLFPNFNSVGEFSNLNFFIGSRSIYNSMNISFSDSSITIPAWDGINATSFSADIRFGKLKANTTYAFSFDSNTSLTTRLYAFLGNSVTPKIGRFVRYFTTDNNGECRDGIVYVEGTGDINDKGRIVISSSTDNASTRLNNLSKVILSNFQLEEGSTATAYEPPIQSPDYPIAINSLNKSFDIVSSVGGRNLVYDSMNTHISIGTSARVRYNVNFEEFKKIEGKEINISFEAKSTILGLASVYTLDLGNYTVNGMYTSAVSIGEVGIEWKKYSVFVKVSNNIELKTKAEFTLAHNSATLHTVEVKDLKIEEGSTATPYSPAPEDIQPNIITNQTYKTSLTLTEPLRSVGSVKDRLFLDADGLWKVERNIHSQTFTSVNQHYISNKIEGLTRFRVDTPVNKQLKLPNYHNISTNRFKTLAGNRGFSGNEIGFSAYSYVGQQNFFYGTMPTSLLSADSIIGLNEFFSSNPLYIQFELATPTIETLSPEQQTYLNHIASFNGTNYVYAVANLNPNLIATFKPADWYKENLLINSLKIYNRPLTSQELLLNYKTEKQRWGL